MSICSEKRQFSAEEFKQFCYELYKLDWVADHVSPEVHLDTRVKWFLENTNDSFEKWVEERGFEGQIWASYPEFLSNEFRSEEYMEFLLYYSDELLSFWDSCVGR